MADEAPKPAPLPTAEEEFVFEDIESVPAYAKDWAGFSGGPVLQVPQGDAYDTTGPYHTAVARKGDTVKFIPMGPDTGAHFEVVAGSVKREDAPVPSADGIVVQRTNASLEDQIKTGNLAVGDLTDDQKAQVLGRSPGMKRLIEPEAA